MPLVRGELKDLLYPCLLISSEHTWEMAFGSEQHKPLRSIKVEKGSSCGFQFFSLFVNISSQWLGLISRN